MNGAPSSTYFTAAPDWEWLIVLYFLVQEAQEPNRFGSSGAVVAEPGAN